MLSMMLRLLQTAPLIGGRAEFGVLLWVLGVSAVALLLAWLGQMPGNRARRRGIRGASVIGLLGWVGLVLWPLWVMAMFWSRRRAARRKLDLMSVTATCPPRDPIPRAAD
jgi:hypothetical protein